MSTLDDLRKLREGTTPGPWLTPAEAGDPYEVKVVDHEGCQVWPWFREEDMWLAYTSPGLVDYAIHLAEAVEALLEDGSDLQGLMDGGAALRAALDSMIEGLK